MSISPKVKQIMNILKVKDTQPAVVDISPMQAKELLRFNTNNRRVSEKMVNRYSNRMTNNQWKNSNDAISFSEIGELSNGQHRLRAIIKADKTVSMLVTFNTNNFTDMDRGKSRTISDNIQTDSRFKGTELATNRNLHQIANTLVRVNKGSRTEVEDVAWVLQKYGSDLISLEQEGLFSGPQGLSVKSIHAAMFVAYINNVDISLLKHIRKVLSTGITESLTDAPIIGLRDKLLQVIGSGVPVEQMRYKLTLYCINAVEKGSTSKRCSVTDPKYDFVIDD